MSLIIPNLGLFDIHDDSLGEFTQKKIDNINAINSTPAAPFAAVVPSTATLQTKLNEYEAALVASINGTPGQTQAKKDRRTELEDLLTLQAQNCAEIAGTNLALYLDTDYKAKDTQGTPTGELPAVTGLLLHYGDNAGELKASWNPMEDAENFSIQFYSVALNPAGSIVKEFIQGKIGKAKVTFTGLPTGQILFARIRANGGSTKFGAWSDPAEKRVP